MIFHYLFALIIANQALGQEIFQISIIGGYNPSNYGNYNVSEDGRFIVFSSNSNNIVEGDTNSINRGPFEQGNATDVFMFDRYKDKFQRLSLSYNGMQIEDGESEFLASSYNLNNILYYSVGISQFPNDTRIADWDTDNDLYLYDVNTQQTKWLSVSPDGVEGGGPTLIADLSGDGRYAAVYSSSTNFLNNNDPYDSKNQIILFDLETNERTLVTKTVDGEQPIIFRPDGDLTISGDGRFIAFTTRATNLSEFGTGGLFLWDRNTELSELISLDFEGNPIQFKQYFLPEHLTLNEDGRYLFFTSRINRHVTNDPHPDENIGVDGFIYDRITKQTKVVPLGEFDSPDYLRGASIGSMSANGQYIIFTRRVNSGRNEFPELFLYDQFADTVELLLSADMNHPMIPSPNIDGIPRITSDGKCVLFSSVNTLYLMTRDITTSHIENWECMN